MPQDYVAIKTFVKSDPLLLHCTNNLHLKTADDPTNALKLITEPQENLSLKVRLKVACSATKTRDELVLKIWIQHV